MEGRRQGGESAQANLENGGTIINILFACHAVFTSALVKIPDSRPSAWRPHVGELPQDKILGWAVMVSVCSLSADESGSVDQNDCFL